MSGPGATVLTRRPVGDAEMASVRELVAAVGQPGSDPPPTPDWFWVTDTRPIGGRYAGEGRPFAVNTGLDPDREGAGWYDRVEPAFGFRPAGGIGVFGFCGRDEDHRVVGELVLWLAERLDGVIDFDAELRPPLPPGAKFDLLDYEWREVEPYFREMAAGMPGRVAGVPRHGDGQGDDHVVHVGDPAFLRAWLDHPNFRMVK
jgi:hypothetical protein